MMCISARRSTIRGKGLTGDCRKPQSPAALDWGNRMLFMHLLYEFPLRGLVHALYRTRLVGRLRHVIPVRADCADQSQRSEIDTVQGLR
jgi:hypothetical protein